MTAAEALPWWARLLLLRPRTVEASLSRVASSGRHPRVPSPFQIALGVARMWHRIVFRSETIGTSSSHRVRATWRARLLAWRPLRFPFLVAERAVAPLDASGLLSPSWRIERHLLGAHHDGAQLVYDLEILAAAHPGALEHARDAARAVVDGTHPRAAWLRDLCVFEGYHEQLLVALEDACERGPAVPAHAADDPDISFAGYLAWCARQPSGPAELRALRRAGRFTVANGRRDLEPAATQEPS
jgi:hypothetical protein